MRRRDGGGHGSQHHHIDVRVNDRQRAYVREKARGYGITMTELMLRGVEAYTRVFDEEPQGAALVAVNYGVWLHAMRGLLDARQAMRGGRGGPTPDVRTGGRPASVPWRLSWRHRAAQGGAACLRGASCSSP